MTMPVIGQIRAVFGGYGLMLVLSVDAGIGAAEMQGHGPKGYTGHWFKWPRLGEPVGPEVVLKEREEARVRGVSCNSPDCWCRKF